MTYFYKNCTCATSSTTNLIWSESGLNREPGGGRRLTSCATARSTRELVKANTYLQHAKHHHCAALGGSQSLSSHCKNDVTAGQNRRELHCTRKYNDRMIRSCIQLLLHASPISPSHLQQPVNEPKTSKTCFSRRKVTATGDSQNQIPCK